MTCHDLICVDCHGITYRQDLQSMKVEHARLQAMLAVVSTYVSMGDNGQ